MHKIEAIYDGVNFKPLQPIPVKGECKVFITFPTIEENPGKRKMRYLLEPDLSKTPVLGKYDGMVEIPDDFNEPLEDLKEYMY